MNLVDLTIEVAAPPAIVFELFTTEAGLCEWMAVAATVDLRVGGRWRWTHANGDSCSGEYLEIDPPDRLVFTYGWESGPFTEVTPGSTRVEIDFVASGTGTTLHLVHDGLVGESITRHDGGWRHFLGVLRSSLASSEPSEPGGST